MTVYAVDQETSLHWSSGIKLRVIDQGEGIPGGFDEIVPTIPVPDTIIWHATGSLDDASASCNDNYTHPPPGTFSSAWLELYTCYCIEAFED